MQANVASDTAAEIAVYPPRDDFSASKRLQDRSSLSTAEFADDTIPGEINGKDDDNENRSELPPVDRGYAWVFLACAFTAEMITWGIPYATGVFFDYYTTVLFPGENHAILALASTFMTGFMLMCCMLVSPLYTRFPSHRAKMQYLGVLLCAAGLISAGFATAPWHVLVTIGILYPLGGAFYYFPEAGLLFEWFVQRRGLAAGIAYSSGGIGGTVFPFIIQALFDRFSYRTSMIALGIGFTIPGSISVFFTRERIPVKKNKGHSGTREDDENTPARAKPTMKFLRSNAFYCFVAATFAFSLGNLLPNVYLPTFIATLGMKKSNGTALVSALNAASAAGLLILGHLTDRWTVRRVTALAGMGGALATFFLWGFSRNMGILVAYAIVFGFFGLGFPSLWPRMITVIAKNDVSSPPIIISILLFTMGVGNVISGPIADALLASKGFKHAGFAYGIESYGPLLIWIGIVFSLGSLAGASYIDKAGDAYRSQGSHAMH